MDISSLEDEDTMLPWNIRMQLPSGGASYPRRMESSLCIQLVVVHQWKERTWRESWVESENREHTKWKTQEEVIVVIMKTNDEVIVGDVYVVCVCYVTCALFNVSFNHYFSNS
jgi:hypothetical protein